MLPNSLKMNHDSMMCIDDARASIVRFTGKRCTQAQRQEVPVRKRTGARNHRSQKRCRYPRSAGYLIRHGGGKIREVYLRNRTSTTAKTFETPGFTRVRQPWRWLAPQCDLETDAVGANRLPASLETLADIPLDDLAVLEVVSRRAHTAASDILTVLQHYEPAV